MMTPLDLMNTLVLGEEPTIEDFILLVGTIVAFIAFVLWCCFPIHPKENIGHQQFSCKSIQHSFTTSQPNCNYSKGSSGGSGGSGTSSNYGLNSDHSYHCCT